MKVLKNAKVLMSCDGTNTLYVDPGNGGEPIPVGGGGSGGGVFKCEMSSKMVDGYRRYESLTDFADALAAYQRGDFVFAEFADNQRYIAVSLKYDSFEELWYMTLSQINNINVETINWASSGNDKGSVSIIRKILETTSN